MGGSGSIPEPRLDGCQHRARLANPGPAMTLIGTEGGFLWWQSSQGGGLQQHGGDAAGPGRAERADIIIDFAPLANAASKGKGVLCYILHNDAPVPFPGGTPLADFFPGSKTLALPPMPGYGPNTRTLLQFRVWPLNTFNQTTEPDQNPGWVLPPAAPAQGVAVPGDQRPRALRDGGRGGSLGPEPRPVGRVSDGPDRTPRRRS